MPNLGKGTLWSAMGRCFMNLVVIHIIFKKSLFFTLCDLFMHGVIKYNCICCDCKTETKKNEIRI